MLFGSVSHLHLILSPPTLAVIIFHEGGKEVEGHADEADVGLESGLTRQPSAPSQIYSPCPLQARRN